MNDKLNTLEEQLVFEYEAVNESIEENGLTARDDGIRFAYESLLSLLEMRDKKRYIKRKESIFYKKNIGE